MGDYNSFLRTQQILIKIYQMSGKKAILDKLMVGTLTMQLN